MGACEKPPCDAQDLDGHGSRTGLSCDDDMSRLGELSCRLSPGRAKASEDQ